MFTKAWGKQTQPLATYWRENKIINNRRGNIIRFVIMFVQCLLDLYQGNATLGKVYLTNFREINALSVT